jgi:hypothetical protein
LQLDGRRGLGHRSSLLRRAGDDNRAPCRTSRERQS